MSEPSRKPTRPRGTASKGLSSRDQGPVTSIPRTAAAALSALVGIVWIAVYINVAQDGQSLLWMGELGRWNFLIGFGLLFLGIMIAAHPGTPLGRGRGIVTGMLACFLTGLVWIVTYYMAGGSDVIPVVRNLEQYNLMVGIGFMAVGFVYATKWE